MATDGDRMHILQLIEDGEITAAEGLRRLDELTPLAPAAVLEAPQPLGAEHAPPDRDLARWKRWWLIPLYAGLGVTTVGALLMYAAYAAAGLGGWFVLAGLPFGVGVVISALAAGTRSAKWLHLRIQRGDDGGDGPRNIALSFPLPLRLTGWLLRTFGDRIPQLKERGVDDLIIALADSTTADTPFYVDVQDGPRGEHVQVFIG